MRRLVVVLGLLLVGTGAGASDTAKKKATPAKDEKAPAKVEKVDHAEAAAWWLQSYETNAGMHYESIRLGQTDESTRLRMNNAREKFLEHCRATKRDELDCTERLDQALERARRRR